MVLSQVFSLFSIDRGHEQDAEDNASGKGLTFRGDRWHLRVNKPYFSQIPIREGCERRSEAGEAPHR
jgi:hypothetical protein